jgi:tRNA G10  N-methylase Trm11
MKYFFILGKNKNLSLAELCSVFDCQSLEYNGGDAAFLESEEQINATEAIQRLGGTIKIGVIKEKSDIGNKKEIEDKIADIILSKGGAFKGKFKFGISYYGNKKLDTKGIGMEIKKILKEKGVNSRMVTSKDKTLSSVVVEQNKLTSSGLEIVLIKNQNKILVGSTEAVQPFKELSRRDYGRPQRDDRSGMLPPKLAQIMINLAGRKKKGCLLDPFCGSGTVLTEALLLGYGEVIGTDISSRAISDTKKNISWVADKYGLRSFDANVFKQDCTQIATSLPAHSVAKVVTEPYLGPQRGAHNLNKTVAELEKLYSECLREIEKIVKKDGRVVIVFPVFVSGKNKAATYIYPDLGNFSIVSPFTAFKNNNYPNLTSRNSIIYGREGQKVWRELIILAPIDKY